jgi:hypothetical protein
MKVTLVILEHEIVVKSQNLNLEKGCDPLKVQKW